MALDVTEDFEPCPWGFEPKEITEASKAVVPTVRVASVARKPKRDRILE